MIFRVLLDKIITIHFILFNLVVMSSLLLLLMRLFSIPAWQPFSGTQGRPILGASNNFLAFAYFAWIIFNCWSEENTGNIS